MLCSWTHGKDEDSSVRLRQWVENDGCDACLLRGVTRDPLGYAATWNRGRNQAVYGHSLDSWQAYYRQLGIQALSMGSVVLRRRSTGRNWVRTDDMPASFVSSCSEHLLRMVQAEDYLAEHGNGVNLLAQTFQLVDDHRLNQSSAFRQGKLVIEKMELELTRGLRTHGAVDASALQVLARCDGRRTLGQVVAELAQFAKSDPQEIERQASALVRQLVSFGFLVPVGGEAASESNPPIGGPGIDAESTQN